MSLTNYKLTTFGDVLDHVLDAVVGGDASKRNIRQAKKAIVEAYQELPTVRDWRYYFRRLLIRTAASQTSSTITYDHTGGSSERLVTLASGTWPTDAEKYEIIISNVRYEIDRRLSSTTLQLSERANPGADVAAGTSYTLVRDTYELPDDFLAMWELIDVEAPGRITSLPWPSDVFVENRINKTAGQPSFYTVMRTTKFASGYAVVFAPAPSTAREYDAVIKVAPKALTVLDENEGTVTVADASAAVAGTTTNFSQQHVGAVMRISKNATYLPTSLVGQITDDLVNPYALQRVIQRVTDTTNLTLEQVSDYGAALTGSRYRISSRIDIEPGAMFTYFMRLCEAKFAPADRKGVAEREALARVAFQNAAWADQRMREDPGRPYLAHSLADIAASVSPTTEP